MGEASEIKPVDLGPFSEPTSRTHFFSGAGESCEPSRGEADKAAGTRRRQHTAFPSLGLVWFGTLACCPARRGNMRFVLLLPPPIPQLLVTAA